VGIETLNLIEPVPLHHSHQSVDDAGNTGREV
jgi:hypothetical protein